MNNKSSKKRGNIGIDRDTQNKIKALAIISGHKFVRNYIRDLIDDQVKQLSSSDYNDLHCFVRRFEEQEKHKNK
ncbi:hypothetical protein [Limosilactobacillus reuteri]|uniref:hypothetical protein n=1 Tax=Limosilactobacillus reuteri TaxID=1598 RepID=UPI001E43126D|nr:hypothetical protein [Limosilactobacillus reuteri]MCC4487608.1 hypothetical protein [Limosilactobacillus reuteri]